MLKLIIGVKGTGKTKTLIEMVNELAERVEIRHTPELKFIYDTSIDYGNHIEKIIEEIKEKEKKD